jgi:uncharacterized membrane protein YczE
LLSSFPSGLGLFLDWSLELVETNDYLLTTVAVFAMEVVLLGVSSPYELRFKLGFSDWMLGV